MKSIASYGKVYDIMCKLVKRSSKKENYFPSCYINVVKVGIDLTLSYHEQILKSVKRRLEAGFAASTVYQNKRDKKSKQQNHWPYGGVQQPCVFLT